MSGRLPNQVCVITGAASGIGKSIADAMRAEGAQVVGVDIQAAEDDSDTLLADISDEAAVERTVADILRRYGRVDVLVNNAGIWRPGSVETTSLETWEQVFAVNVRGAFLCSRAVIPAMKARASGSIVNISSNYGLVGGLNCAAYVASKGALVTLTYAMALDLAPFGIRVNCVCPGTVDTPIIREPMKSMTPAELEAQHASRMARHPLGRIGRPEEVAPGVIYLASATEAAFVTGAVLAIDGGYVAR